MNKRKKWAMQLGIVAMLLPVAMTTGEESTYANGSNGVSSAVSTTIQANAQQKNITITAYMLNIRKSSSFSSAIVGVAKKGQTYKVLNESNGLYQIGANQWVSANNKYVTVTNGQAAQKNTSVSPTSQKVVIHASALNVRKSASFSSGVVYVAKKGQEFTILETKNGLYRISDNQWISANTKYVSIQNGQASPAKATTVQTPTVQTQPVTQTTQVQVNQKATDIVSIAKSYMGTGYAWGGKTPSGFDCSGFVYYVFKQAGYSNGYMNTSALWNNVTKVSSPQVGDLVFLQNTYKQGVSHVGIYIGGGQMVHAGSDGVEVANLNVSYYKNHFLGYGRL